MSNVVWRTPFFRTPFCIYDLASNRVSSLGGHGGQQQYNGMREMSPTEHATLKRKGNFEIFFHWIIPFPMLLTFLYSLFV